MMYTEDPSSKDSRYSIEYDFYRTVLKVHRIDNKGNDFERRKMLGILVQLENEQEDETQKIRLHYSAIIAILFSLQIELLLRSLWQWALETPLIDRP